MTTMTTEKYTAVISDIEHAAEQGAVEASDMADPTDADIADVPDLVADVPDLAETTEADVADVAEIPVIAATTEAVIQVPTIADGRRGVTENMRLMVSQIEDVSSDDEAIVIIVRTPAKKGVARGMESIGHKMFSGDRKTDRASPRASAARPPLPKNFMRFFSPSERAESERQQRAAAGVTEYRRRDTFVGDRTTSERGQIREKRRMSFTGRGVKTISPATCIVPGPLPPGSDRLDTTLMVVKKEKTRADTPRPGDPIDAPFAKRSKNPWKSKN